MSNTLVPQNNNTGVDVKRISSREVAKMMDTQHKTLLSKIDDISKTLESRKICSLKYWIESTYKVEGNKRAYREYLISKEGCEFLAHKSTGEKGILFTHRYMERFKEMEQQIEQQMVSVEQITQIATEAAQAAVQAAIAPFMDRFEKLIATKEAPKVEMPKVKARYTVTPIAKPFGLTGAKANEKLKKNGIIKGNTKNGWVLNEEYEEAGWGMTCYDGQYNDKPYVRYTEKGKQALTKVLSRVNGQEQIKLF